MEVQEIHVAPSAPGRVRLTGAVRYDSRPSATETYWFEVPERFASDLASSGNPWLVCLAPVAATLHEPLRIGLPVDRLLAHNIRELLHIWSHWYPALRAVPLELEVSDPVGNGEPRRTGAFFSGGVDSFYTVLHHRKYADAAVSVDDLILVQGFDYPLEHAEAFERHRRRMELAAAELDMDLVVVSTNLRETRFREASWSDLCHISALCGVGLALERRYRYLLVGSTSPYGELTPYGSHPLTDVLNSTAATKILHDGAEATRLDKMQYLAGSDLALRFLHVCFREISDRNCGRCRKCTLTWLGLWLCGAGDRAATFPAGAPDLRQVRRILMTTGGQRRSLRRLQALAARQGRRDIVRAIRGALRRSTVLGAILPSLDKWRGRKVRGLSTVASRTRRTLMARVVR